MSDPSDNWVSKATRHPSRGGLRRILCASLEEADSFVKSGCHHRAIRSPQSGPRLNNKSGRSVGNWVHSVRSIRYCLPRVRLSIRSPLLPLSSLLAPFSLSLSLSPARGIPAGCHRLLTRDCLIIFIGPAITPGEEGWGKVSLW